MCLNNFRHELSTALMAQTFEGFNDLCTKAHDMELHLSKRRRPRVVDRLETSTAAAVETKKGGPIVVAAQKPKETKKATMKERLEKNYSFTDDLVEDMFEDLLEQKLITLPEVKRPHEEGKTTHPKYCPYHRLISHKLRDCFVLKDKIQELFDSKTIELPPLEKMTANPITADDDDGEGEWIIYQSKGMKKRQNSSCRTKAPFVPKKPRKPKTSKKIKRTKVSKSAAKKKKGPKKQKREEPVSDEPLKQSPRIRVTLEEFLPKELQSLELRAYFKKKREGAVIQVPCLNIIVISEDEDEEDEGSSITRPIHILDSPTSSQHDLVVEECMATPRGYVTPKGTMASPDFSPIPPMLYMNTPEYVINSPQRYVGYGSDSKLLKSSRKRLRFEGWAADWYFSLPPNSIPDWDTMAKRFYRRFYMPRPMEFEMWEPYENISFQAYELLEGTAEEKLEAALNQRDMGGFRPRGLFPPWVEQTPFPLGYNLPNFSIYEGHGDPEKHIKLFLRQCGRTAQNQALCLRQFPLSLDGIAFDWYCSLDGFVVPSWEAMKGAFIQSQYFYRWDSRFLRSARKRYPQEGEVITDDEHSSVGSTNMVQISDEPKVGDDNGKEIVEVCKTFLTYKRQPRNPNQGSQVPIKEGDAPKEEE
ncbi:hypothetical protein Vadar_023999 [Vaccinium darrowii]|uniref:Uncharacterized protein n=1 Tax=Vaccinium darrowii TaxID=229202 RepID=A0ACB7YRB6_9ERIC|nr:hypothetical protein Vadar_023999 [Vaccinium darrowii]